VRRSHRGSSLIVAEQQLVLQCEENKAGDHHKKSLRQSTANRPTLLQFRCDICKVLPASCVPPSHPCSPALVTTKG
jgi:hypothetical protein